jgi:cytochrome c553
MLACICPFTAAAASPSTVSQKTELCTHCHKADNVLWAPTLEGQPREYLYRQMLAYKEKRRV